jgi:hypothetical protein
MTIVKSLHEIFLLMDPTEDMSKIRECFKYILSRIEVKEGSPENSTYLDLISLNIDAILSHYVNDHYLENVDQISDEPAFGDHKILSNQGFTPMHHGEEESKGMMFTKEVAQVK